MKDEPSPPAPQKTTSGPGPEWNSPIGRRRFLTGTGKAGAMTILSLHGLKIEVLAIQPSGSPGA